MPVLRIATPSDAAAVLAIYAPVVQNGYASFEAEPPSVDEIAERMKAVLERYPWVLAQDGDAILGYAYATAHRGRAGYRWSAEVSVYVAPEAHRRGVGRALYAGLFGLLNAQGIVNLYAGIALPNAASVGLHEALGFIPIARYPTVGFKAGAWHDTGWWHLRINPLADDPVPPTAFPDLDPETIRDRLQEGSIRLRP